MNANAQPMIINCATGFGLMLPNHLRKVLVTPETSEKRLKRIAPKITVTGVNTSITAEAIFALIIVTSVAKKIR